MLRYVAVGAGAYATANTMQTPAIQKGFAALATKWVDGNRFTMNFTGAGGGKGNDSFNTVSGRFVLR